MRQSYICRESVRERQKENREAKCNVQHSVLNFKNDDL
jgi:hypothetical protein